LVDHRLAPPRICALARFVLERSSCQGFVSLLTEWTSTILQPSGVFCKETGSKTGGS
jgi:hypothetical protein